MPAQKDYNGTDKLCLKECVSQAWFCKAHSQKLKSADPGQVLYGACNLSCMLHRAPVQCQHSSISGSMADRTKLETHTLERAAWVQREVSHALCSEHFLSTAQPSHFSWSTMVPAEKKHLVPRAMPKCLCTHAAAGRKCHQPGSEAPSSNDPEGDDAVALLCSVPTTVIVPPSLISSQTWRTCIAQSHADSARVWLS